MNITGKRLKINGLRKERWTVEGKLMGKPKEMLAGPLVTRHARCGKPNCRCKKRGAKGHGPYYYVQIKMRGRYTNVYLGKRKDLIELAGNYSKYVNDIVNLRRINRKIDRLLEDINRSKIRKGVK